MDLLSALREQSCAHLSGGLYHNTQILFAYHSNRIEGCRLSSEQTRYLFETNTIMPTDSALNADDLVETINHFCCFDLLLERIGEPLSEPIVKELHQTLKSSTSQARASWFVVGGYKRIPNEVAMLETTPPSEVPGAMRRLLEGYAALSSVALEEIVDLHYHFEAIHPFQDGNGRVGRLLMFRECLAHGIMPFIITEEQEAFYYRGLQEYPRVKGYLLDTCRTAQDEYAAMVQRFAR